MKCPICCSDTRVNAYKKYDDSVTRWRICINSKCRYIFKTTEIERDILERLDPNHKFMED